MSGGLSGERHAARVDSDLVEGAEHTDLATELRLRLAALETALAATQRVLQPSLVEFLRR
jgi:hypothetical protein